VEVIMTTRTADLCPSQLGPDEFAILVTECGTTTTISLTGEWDLAQQPAARDAIRSVLRRCPEVVVFDLSRLSFIDSSGLHDMLELDRRARHQNIRLVIIPGCRRVQRLFEICQLLDVLPFIGAGQRE
jgi:anti-anti-sigma factor